ncbi:LADA_0H12772g1_1 [Lachancea dasiensis]|uniref:LADA_0H12772g1_1 n=1 Tax=Lachancea dasiensis TaxID=1072105 RepID=A0A1G4K3U5_9SACH|nr:LADA_0H12772g1_1 [Lachancea dasiensis]
MESKILPRSRIPSLYSDFRQLQELNPEGYEANVRSWKHFLLDQLLLDDLILQCGHGLLKRLSNPENGEPRSLDVVLDALVADGSIVAMDHFKSNNKRWTQISGAITWTLGAILPMISASSKTRISERQPYLREQSYVVLPTVERKYVPIEKAIRHRICQNATRYSDLVFSRREFLAITSMDTQLKNSDEVDVMLAYMEYHKKLITIRSDTVKVCSNDVSMIVTKFGGFGVSEDDVCIASLKETKSQLNAQVANLEERIRISKELVSMSVQQCMAKDIQKTRLRTQKLLEKNMTVACQSLQSVEQLLNEVELAMDNVHLKNTFENSRKALMKISTLLGDVDEIEEIMEDIKAENLRNEKIGEILGDNLDKQADDELERELEKMGTEQEADTDMVNRLAGLKIVAGSPEEPEKSKDSKLEKEPLQEPAA